MSFMSSGFSYASQHPGAPSFAEAGDARVSISLNGHDYETPSEQTFRYVPSSSCSVQ